MEVFDGNSRQTSSVRVTWSKHLRPRYGLFMTRLIFARRCFERLTSDTTRTRPVPFVVNWQARVGVNPEFLWNGDQAWHGEICSRLRWKVSSEKTSETRRHRRSRSFNKSKWFVEVRVNPWGIFSATRLT